MVHLYGDAVRVRHAYDVEVALGDLEGSMASVGRQRVKYLTNGTAESLGDFTDAVNKVTVFLARVRQLTSNDPAQQKLCDQLEAFAKERVGFSQSSVELKVQNRSTAEAQSELTAEIAKTAFDTSTTTGEMRRNEDALLQVQNRYLHLWFTALPVILAVSFALSAFMFWLHYHMLNRELRSSLEARAQAKRAEEESRGLLEAAPDAVVVVNQEGRIGLVNAQAEKLFGYHRGELLGQTIGLLVPHLDPELHLAGHEGSSAAPPAQSIHAGLELHGMRKDGSEFPVDVSLSPVEIGGASFVISDIRDISEKKKAEETLRSLSGQLLQVQDEERRELARTLHDSTGSKLAVLSMNASQLLHEQSKLSPESVSLLHENSQLVYDLAKEIRTLSHLLHPPLLDEVGLPAALHEYVDGFSRRSKIQTALECPHLTRQLPREIQTSIYRLVQECLTNVHRHSHSETASVRLFAEGDQVMVEVKDSGTGIHVLDFASREWMGVGIRGMRERVRQFGGKFEIQSDGHGTTVMAVFPIEGAGATQGKADHASKAS